MPPHPLYDLAPEQLHELARRAYPLIVEQLTKQEAITPVVKVSYERPARPAQPARKETE